MRFFKEATGSIRRRIGNTSDASRPGDLRSLDRGTRTRRRPGIRLEMLEDRTLLSTFQVTNLDPDGEGSLRWAIVQANADPDRADDIVFADDLAGTIELTAALPDLTGELSITGPGAETLTIARNTAEDTPDFSVFVVSAGAKMTLSGLTITGGRAENGGGISNEGSLTLTDIIVTDNTATSTGGGGLFNSGTAAITNSTFSHNLTWEGSGGGLYNFGTATISGSTFSDNLAREGGGLFRAFIEMV
jgi:hypothetical protein